MKKTATIKARDIQVEDEIQVRGWPNQVASVHKIGGDFVTIPHASQDPHCTHGLSAS